MAVTVSIDQLADEIVRTMTEYNDNVTAAIGAEVESTAAKILEDVKAQAPFRYGEYEAGFLKQNKSLPGNKKYVVWNRKHYNRVHLLEKGHAKTGGGFVMAFPHMGPAEDTHIPEFESNIERILQNGG